MAIKFVSDEGSPPSAPSRSYEVEGETIHVYETGNITGPHEIIAQHDRLVADAFKKTRAPNGSFDRKAYQRELMRKRRKADKENSPK